MLIICYTIVFRYIEIFKSSLNEATANIVQDFGMPKQPRPLMQGMRPSPYNRNERMMGGMNSGMGMSGNFGYGRGRGRNLKGKVQAMVLIQPKLF